MLKKQKIKKSLKASVLEKPAHSVKHPYTEVILDLFVDSNVEKEETIYSTYIFDNMCSFFCSKKFKLILPLPTYRGSLIL